MPLMTNEDWNDIESSGRFRRSEFKDNPMKLDRSLVYKLLNMRIEAGKPFHIHCAYQQGGHSAKSQHYLGKACDLDIAESSLSYQVQLAFRHGFRGIGAYPNWNKPGIHVDIREGSPVYWIEEVKGSGNYTYYASVEELLKALEV